MLLYPKVAKESETLFIDFYGLLIRSSHKPA